MIIIIIIIVTNIIITIIIIIIIIFISIIILQTRLTFAVAVIIVEWLNTKCTTRLTGYQTLQSFDGCLTPSNCKRVFCTDAAEF